MSAAFDIILLVIIIAAVLNGFRKGLVKSLIELGGGILAIIIAFNLSPSVGDYIGKNYLAPPIKKAFVTELAKSSAVKTTENTLNDLQKIDVEKLLKDSPEFLQKLLKSYGVTPEKILSQNEANKAKMTVEDYKKQLIDSIVDPVAKSAGTVIAFIAIFILVLLAAKLISFLMGFIKKIPVIGQVDKLGGLGIGLINGIFIIIVLCGALKLVFPYIQKEGNTNINTATIENTVAFKFFYNINPLDIKIK
jgi:uncharacterized membrane protein required for colicin V production